MYLENIAKDQWHGGYVETHTGLKNDEDYRLGQTPVNILLARMGEASAGDIRQRLFNEIIIPLSEDERKQLQDVGKSTEDVVSISTSSQTEKFVKLENVSNKEHKQLLSELIEDLRSTGTFSSETSSPIAMTPHTFYDYEKIYYSQIEDGEIIAKLIKSNFFTKELNELEQKGINDFKTIGYLSGKIFNPESIKNGIDRIIIEVKYTTMDSSQNGEFTFILKEDFHGEVLSIKNNDSQGDSNTAITYIHPLTQGFISNDGVINLTETAQNIIKYFSNEYDQYRNDNAKVYGDLITANREEYNDKIELGIAVIEEYRNLLERSMKEAVDEKQSEESIRHDRNHIKQLNEKILPLIELGYFHVVVQPAGLIAIETTILTEDMKELNKDSHPVDIRCGLKAPNNNWDNELTKNVQERVRNNPYATRVFQKSVENYSTNSI